ncbi:bifunctional tetrahydrofolate synthase/dihydrofolate synthase [Shewanella waksmanii]|uniref:bifunctional tetrahydrofolate synthase/dihydrofolate synthase n=1 Tax=Shewanella waksmanii TaxID=213783 RepID=UPI00048E6AE8|nr:bifunctional tetrahydrofolate synthase/dihydrofolate synthase [Shewanella waksmanii]
MKLSQQTSLDEWLAYLLELHPTEIDMGLTRVKQVARQLGVVDLGETKVITVAGTNGKGSTCAMLESILRQQQIRVGVYSSPHMLRYNERVRIDGQDANDQDLVDAFCAIDSARGDISLTFFEYATLAGLYLFKAAQLDVVLLEVGLGGRLDATNIIDADVAVITSIDLDHQEYLGDTRELVGREKAGVFRTNKCAIVGEADMPTSIVQYSEQIRAKLIAVGKQFSYQEQHDSWCFTGMVSNLTALPKPSLPLANAATALAVIEQLWPDMPATAIAQGLQQAKLTGRFEQVSAEPTVLLDVAHNPHAARYLAKKMAAYQPKKVIAICGMLKDKDCSSVLSIMSDVVDEWHLVDLDCPRSAAANDLQNNLPTSSQSHTYASIALAWQHLIHRLSKDDVVIIFGSFYTVAEFKALKNEFIQS